MTPANQRFVVIPTDVFKCLNDRHLTISDAEISAKDRTGETGMTHVVVNVVCEVSRESPPVVVRRLK